MTFKSSVIPGVRAFASNMRVKLSREPLKSARDAALFAAPSYKTSLRASVSWRICPATGQLQQRWNFDDSQDPQSPGLAQLLQRAGLTLNLSVEARAA
ncbi:hypothetical protein [Pseudomonas sp. FEN]|uniref:hypothetical protein n=1 Tax=Pseudomonas sp. FEN TaxID=2767468 RepID=UPI00174C88F5|nr:hypothetical protein [Pseudomonas sp. FEN]CAD5200883.1 hypothetical protein [Pseudomonas sp. FEN]